jgi:hypothetical protein
VDKAGESLNSGDDDDGGNFDVKTQTNYLLKYVVTSSL